MRKRRKEVGKMGKKKRKSLDEILEEALENAPTIQGYTIKQLSEITSIPWTTSRWHLERLEAKGGCRALRIRKS
jgi:DNA-binding transcriptional ArsR family regulator